MKYLPSPLNVLALFLIIYAIYTAFSDGPVGDGLTKFWVVPAIGLAIVFFIVDFILQKNVIKYMSLLYIELFIICMIFIIPKIIGFINKANTLRINPASVKPYSVMIYDVKNADKVFKKGFREAPLNGVVFNSKKQEANQREIHLSAENIIAHSYFDDQLICRQKTYNYRAWFIFIESNMKYDEDSLKVEIKKHLLTQCEIIEKIESSN